MPSLTPMELQEARRKSGRLGGRPKKPTVEEARRAALDELVPKALRVLNEHLDKGGPDALEGFLEEAHALRLHELSSNSVANPRSRCLPGPRFGNVT